MSGFSVCFQFLTLSVPSLPPSYFVGLKLPPSSMLAPCVLLSLIAETEDFVTFKGAYLSDDDRDVLIGMEVSFERADD